jgi:hypothetical protein
LTYAEWPENIDSKMKPPADHVACQLSFVPTFATMNPQDVELTYGEKPEEADLAEFYQTGLLFTFLIDCSGSMMMHKRLDIAKNALKLFLKSLPPLSRFEIVRFGTRYDFMTSRFMEYSDFVVNQVIE